MLEGNRNGTLTAEERAELDEMNRINHFVTLIKGRALKAIKERGAASQV